MNTFATLLLAYPFYLMVKGKLPGYIALAKPDAGSSAANSQAAVSTPSASPMTMTANAAPAAPAAPSTDLASTMSNVAHIFGDVATVAGVV